jgi:DNA-binding CsgD family transcriptional regulator
MLRPTRWKLRDESARTRDFLLSAALEAANDLPLAQDIAAEGLASARAVGDLMAETSFLNELADIAMRRDDLGGAGRHMCDSLQIATRIGDRLRVLDCIDFCGALCASGGSASDALTMWTFVDATYDPGFVQLPITQWRRIQFDIQASLGHDEIAAAELRGANMTLATAVELATLFAADLAKNSTQPSSPRVPRLSPREAELVTLVARGNTDAQIAQELFISIRTVRSHLDRIRDKTGCRRRADLTRLALQAQLV